MYKNAIKANSSYLIPFTFGIKYFGTDKIYHGSGTLMAVNSDGYIITCKHIAKIFVDNDQLIKEYPNLLKKLDKDREGTIKELKLEDDTGVLSAISLPFEYKQIKIIFHDTLDLAIIHFEGVEFDLLNYPTFSRSLVEIGQSLCKLGFAFPEYEFFEYSEDKKQIVFTKDMKHNFPLFPLDGIATRYNGKNGSTFEMSTPGVKGQSGGPIFSPEGIVYGIQSMTKVLDMNTELEIKVLRGVKEKKEIYNPFLSLGVGVSSTEICKFLEENNVKFRSV